MADIALTEAQVEPIYPDRAEIFTFIANAAIAKGEAVYMLTTGKVAPADANAAGLQQACGIALEGVGAGQAVSVLKQGHVAGYTVSGMNAWALVYLSDTVGNLADAAGTMEVRVGRVVPLPDNSLTKVIYFDFVWDTAWA